MAIANQTRDLILQLKEKRYDADKIIGHLHAIYLHDEDEFVAALAYVLDFAQQHKLNSVYDTVLPQVVAHIPTDRVPGLMQGAIRLLKIRPNLPPQLKAAVPLSYWSVMGDDKIIPPNDIGFSSQEDMTDENIAKEALIGLIAVLHGEGFVRSAKNKDEQSIRSLINTLHKLYAANTRLLGLDVLDMDMGEVEIIANAVENSPHPLAQEIKQVISTLNKPYDIQDVITRLVDLYDQYVYQPIKDDLAIATRENAKHKVAEIERDMGISLRRWTNKAFANDIKIAEHYLRQKNLISGDCSDGASCEADYDALREIRDIGEAASALNAMLLYHVSERFDIDWDNVAQIFVENFGDEQTSMLFSLALEQTRNLEDKCSGECDSRVEGYIKVTHDKIAYLYADTAPFEIFWHDVLITPTAFAYRVLKEYPILKQLIKQSLNKVANLMIDYYINPPQQLQWLFEEDGDISEDIESISDIRWVSLMLYLRPDKYWSGDLDDKEIANYLHQTFEFPFVYTPVEKDSLWEWLKSKNPQLAADLENGDNTKVTEIIKNHLIPMARNYLQQRDEINVAQDKNDQVVSIATALRELQRALTSCHS